MRNSVNVLADLVTARKDEQTRDLSAASSGIEAMCGIYGGAVDKTAPNQPHATYVYFGAGTTGYRIEKAWWDQLFIHGAEDGCCTIHLFVRRTDKPLPLSWTTWTPAMYVHTTQTRNTSKMPSLPPCMQIRQGKKINKRKFMEVSPCTPSPRRSYCLPIETMARARFTIEEKSRN
ncbi:hypothetical protein BR93DRAFT_7495 [Coniochaeta sp. PMI_546]|nr:hypothetical protein BR93DRAFT_7495 [Coniochaeta sp. PMI_546]